MMMQKLLFFQWHSFMNQGIENALKELEIEYNVEFYPLQNWEADDKFLKWFSGIVDSGMYGKVFSVNFVPLISQVCEEKGVEYVSWIYDSPVHIRDLDSMKRSCNRIWHFDRGQAEAYQKMGIPVGYMPLAVDSRVFGKQDIWKYKRNYTSDVSFVGKLYQTEYNYFSGVLSEYQKGYLEGILKAQSKVFGGYLIDELVTKELLQELNISYEKASNGTFRMEARELEFLLASEVTSRERRIVLELLGKFFEVDWYSGDEEEITQVRKKGYADYYTQMPEVFAKSKVNLNVSLKTIRTGVPLRVLDVLGCGGFLISNFQPEIAEYFQIGEEIEVYENMEDLVCKTQFYLENEDLRETIAHKGYEKVQKCFSFRERLKEMLL